MKLLSMYSGVGGMDYAAHMAGIETVAFCELDEWNRKVLARHWPGKPIFESDEQVTGNALREIGIERIDIIAGGAPCQPFSVAGKGLGVADSRHRWPQMARVIAELRPAFAVVENVAGFANVAEQLVRPELARLGYRTVRFDIPAAGVEAPHKRERIFIVAYDDRDDVRTQSIALQECAGETIARQDRETAVADDDNAERAAAYNDDGCNASGNEPCRRDSNAAVGDDDERGRRIKRLARRASDECAKPQCADCERRRSSVADDDHTGLGERRRAESVSAQHAPVKRGRSREQQRAEAVEHDAGAGREGSAECGLQHGVAPTRRCTGESEPGLGGVLSGITDWMDAFRWPAPRLVYIDNDLKEWPLQSPQYEWEPPRTTSERHERRKRLKALGNICVPLQAIPIFAAIGALRA